MGNCLVTKLKGSVDNVALPFLGYLQVKNDDASAVSLQIAVGTEETISGVMNVYKNKVLQTYNERSVTISCETGDYYDIGLIAKLRTLHTDARAVKNLSSIGYNASALKYFILTHCTSFDFVPPASVAELINMEITFDYINNPQEIASRLLNASISGTVGVEYSAGLQSAVLTTKQLAEIGGGLPTYIKLPNNTFNGALENIAERRRGLGQNIGSINIDNVINCTWENEDFNYNKITLSWTATTITLHDNMTVKTFEDKVIQNSTVITD